MSQDFYVIIGLCVFMFLLGMRLKERRRVVREKSSSPIRKNQRSKMAHSGEEPPLVRERRLRRERRTRYFTVVLLFVLFALIIFMIPALVADIYMPERIRFSNFFLRCFIFIFTIYLFVLAYLKVFQRKKGADSGLKKEKINS